MSPALLPLSSSDGWPRLIDGPTSAPATVLLAHGAGAPMDSPFLDTIATGLAAQGWRVVRFEFPYMARQREGASRGAPDRLPKLLDRFREQVELEAGGPPLVLGRRPIGLRVGRLAGLRPRLAADPAAASDRPPETGFASRRCRSA